MIEIEQRETNPTRVKVIGVGGGGGNVIDRMVEENILGLDFVAINTDLQALSRSKAHQKIQIGSELTKGLGAGAAPDIGKRAAEENVDEIRGVLQGANMVFITAGMGGGTGTGASPIVASLAREMDILTVAVVTKPFEFEGSKRMAYAREGIKELQKYIDTLIVVPNENLLKVFGDTATVLDCFRQADRVLMQGVKAISELVILPGVINVDFSDLRTVMKNKGASIMGMASTTLGKNGLTAEELAKKVIENPLLERGDMTGSKGILINIKHGKNIALAYLNDFSRSISSRAHKDADVIIGVVLDQENDDKVTVTLIATGIEQDPLLAPKEVKETPAQASIFTKAEVVPKIDKTFFVNNEAGFPKEVSESAGEVDEFSLLTNKETLEFGEKIVKEPFFGKGEYIDLQNVEVPAFLRKKNADGKKKETG